MRLGGLTLSELHDQTGLPACFIEQLLMNDMRPDTSWAKDLAVWPEAKQLIFVMEPIQTKADRTASPYVCLWTEVQFCEFRPQFREVDRVRMKPRTWPQVSFVEHAGEFWEITGGQVFWLDRWRWAWNAYRNTELARHFRGIHEDCVPCRQLKMVEECGHLNYGVCSGCRKAFPLVPWGNIGGIPRHECGGVTVAESVEEKLLEPKEAKLWNLGNFTK